MKFTNAIAYCKGWYQTNGLVSETWKDLAHCFIADGYLCYNKHDVTCNCLAQIADIAENYPKLAPKVSLSKMVSHMELLKLSNKTYQEDLTNDDYVIYAYIQFVKYDINKSYFTSGVLPSDKVLPLNPLANLSDLSYDEQQFNSWQHTYDEIEEQLKK